MVAAPVELSRLGKQHAQYGIEMSEPDVILERFCLLHASQNTYLLSIDPECMFLTAVHPLQRVHSSSSIPGLRQPQQCISGDSS